MFSFTVRPSASVSYNPEVRSAFVAGTYFWSNVFGHLPFVYFLFLTVPSCTVYFLLTPLLIFPHICCFCNTCSFVTFRTSVGVAGLDIILLYSEMASMSIRYTCNCTLLQFFSIIPSCLMQISCSTSSFSIVFIATFSMRFNFNSFLVSLTAVVC